MFLISFFQSRQIEKFKKLATEGNIDAQFKLAVIYLEGKLNVVKNIDLAILWFQKAAEQGHVEAKFYLGTIYYDGRDIQQDHTKALEWFSQAAELGYPKAQHQLGLIYYKGTNGVIKDYIKASEWFKKAAEQGDVTAQIYLAGMFCGGKGVEQDYIKAAEWLQKAVETNNSTAQLLLGVMYQDGSITRNYPKALELFQKAANQGKISALSYIGKMYKKGQGVSRNYATAIQYIKIAAEQGDAVGQYLLGTMYQYAFGVPRNYVAALEWYKSAAELNHPNAIITLGEMYKEGSVCVNQNYAQSIEWFQKAVEQGYGSANVFLGIMYEKGLGVDKDHVKALKCYNQALNFNSIGLSTIKKSQIMVLLALQKMLKNLSTQMFKAPFETNHFIDIIDIIFIDQGRPFEKIIDFIIANGGNINVTDLNGVTLLMFACVMNNYNATEKLIINGANKNAADNHATVMHYAINNADPKLLTFMLEQGCTIDTPDSDGDSPEFWAIEIENLKTICELKRHDGSYYLVDLNRIQGSTNENLIESAKIYNATKCIAYLEQCIAIRHTESLNNTTQQQTNLFFSPNHVAGCDELVDNNLEVHSPSERVESLVTNFSKCIIS